MRACVICMLWMYIYLMSVPVQRLCVMMMLEHTQIIFMVSFIEVSLTCHTFVWGRVSQETLTSVGLYMWD